MSDRPQNRIELVREALSRNQETLRGVTEAEATEFITDELRLHIGLTEEDKESFRRNPERFFRNFLEETDAPYPVNAVAVRCHASPPFSDDCSMLQTGDGQESAPIAVHTKDSVYQVL